MCLFLSVFVSLVKIVLCALSIARGELGFIPDDAINPCFPAVSQPFTLIITQNTLQILKHFVKLRPKLR